MSEEGRTPPEAPPEEAASAEGEARQPDGQDKPRRQEKRVVVRYGRMGHLGALRHHLESPPPPGTQLVIRTARGTELGQVLVNIGEGPHTSFIEKNALEEYLRANGGDNPIYRGGGVLRLANAQDLNDQAHLQRASAEKAALCEEFIAELKLDMKLVAVEHLLGGERIVFYFSAEHRVDFRELVRRLAGRYHTRIEMRQVGARDEARLVADYERCGMQCCCQTFLKFLKPISMRMAKIQKATLDPTKISGRCGRLMCCLRYEDATYEKLAKALPKRNTWVRTADGMLGKVIDAHTLTQLVRLMLPDRSQQVVAVEEIAERDLPEPTGEEIAAASRPKPDRARETAGLEAALERIKVPEAPADEGKDRAGGDRKSDQAGKKRPRRRRGRRRKKTSAAQADAGGGNAPSQGQGSPKPDGGKPDKKRRRRRRKKKKPDSGGGDAAVGKT